MATVSRNAHAVKSHHVSTNDLWDAYLDGMDQDFDPKRTPGDWRPVLGYAVYDGEFIPECSLDFPEDEWDHPSDADRADYRQHFMEEFERELDELLNRMDLDRDLAELSDRDDDFEDIDPEGSVADYSAFEPGDGPLSDRDIERATGSCG